MTRSNSQRYSVTGIRYDRATLLLAALHEAQIDASLVPGGIEIWIYPEYADDLHAICRDHEATATPGRTIQQSNVLDSLPTFEPFPRHE